jgi:hypothetical protein
LKNEKQQKFEKLTNNLDDVNNKHEELVDLSHNKFIDVRDEVRFYLIYKAKPNIF